MECLSLWELCKGNLKGGLLYWGYVNKGSGTATSLQQGPRWVTVEGGSFTQDYMSPRCDFVSSEELVYWGLRKVRKTMHGQRASVSIGAPWMESHLPRTLKGM